MCSTIDMPVCQLLLLLITDVKLVAVPMSKVSGSVSWQVLGALTAGPLVVIESQANRSIFALAQDLVGSSPVYC